MSNNENYCWLMWRNGLDMDSLVETVERGHWANGRKRENGWKEEAKRGKDEIAVFGRGGPQAPPTFIDFHLFYFIFLYYFFLCVPQENVHRRFELANERRGTAGIFQQVRWRHRSDGHEGSHHAPFEVCKLIFLLMILLHFGDFFQRFWF